VLTQALSWHWIFFVNLPVGALAGLLALRLLDSDRGIGLRAGADAPGALLVTAGLMLGVYALVTTTRYGWGSLHTIGSAAAAWLLIGAFIVRQARTAAPLLPLRIFSARNVGGANLAQVLVIAAAFGFQILITLYMQRVLGYRPGAAGLGLVPTAAMIGAISLGFSARLNARFGARAVLLTGLALIVLALVLLTHVPVDGGYSRHLLPALLVFGAGGGLVLPALAATAMSSATPGDAGITSGLFNTSQQIGAALGIAVLSTLAAGRTADLQRAGIAAAAALTGGYHLAFGAGAGLGVASIIVTAVLLRPSPRAGRDGQAAGRSLPAAGDQVRLPDDPPSHPGGSSRAYAGQTEMSWAPDRLP
jgi:MFS family permease